MTIPGTKSTLEWTKDLDSGKYIVQITLAAGENELNIPFSAIHTGFGDPIIYGDQTLILNLKKITAVNASGEPVDLDLALHDDISVGNSYLGGQEIRFTIVDEEYAKVAAHGIGEEAIGKELVALSAVHAQPDGTHLYEGSDGHQVIIGTEGADVIYGGGGNNILVGGGGDDIFAFARETGSNTNTIMDFRQDGNHDILRFDDLFGGAAGGQETLDALLGTLQSGDPEAISAIWESDGNTGTLTYGGTKISLSVDEAAASLKLAVSYDAHNTQEIVLQGFTGGNLFNEADGALDPDAVATMLQEILRIA